VRKELLYFCEAQIETFDELKQCLEEEDSGSNGSDDKGQRNKFMI
jgi:hypothetical protein